MEFVDSYLDATASCFSGFGEPFEVPQQMQMNSLGCPTPPRRSFSLCSLRMDAFLTAPATSGLEDGRRSCRAGDLLGSFAAGQRKANQSCC